MNIFSKSVKARDDSESPCGRFITLILFQAVQDGASKIVFGEPCEHQCQRLPWEPDSTPFPPWEDENIARITGRSDQDVAEERQASLEERRKSRSERRELPIWFKVGDIYRELASIPGTLFLPILSVVNAWNGCRITFGGGQPRPDSLLLSEAGSARDEVLSRFLLILPDSRPVIASLRFEESYCLSFSIHETNK